MARHGGNLEKLRREKDLSNQPLLDFSANINPLGMPELFKSVMLENFECLEHYPDYEYRKLKESLADHYGCHWSQLTVGNGAEEIIQNYMRVCQGPIIILEPTFSEYRVAAEKAGRSIYSYVLRRQENFQLKVDRLLEYIDQEKISQASLFLCRPNNPTGVLYPLDHMQFLCRELQKRDIRLVLDESFIEFTSEKSMLDFIHDHPNLLLIQSLTKFYAIPGLRLGFAGSSDLALIQAMEEVRGDWNVNVFADLCGQKIGQLGDYRKESKAYVKRERDRLKQALQSLSSIRVLLGSANFLFLEFVDEHLGDRMLEKGIVLRSCSNFLGLSAFDYRVAVRSHEENNQVIQAFKELDGQ